MKSVVLTSIGRVGGAMPTHGKRARIEVGEGGVRNYPGSSVAEVEQEVVLWHTDGCVALILDLAAMDALIDQLTAQRLLVAGEVEKARAAAARGFTT